MEGGSADRSGAGVASRFPRPKTDVEDRANVVVDEITVVAVTVLHAAWWLV